MKRRKKERGGKEGLNSKSMYEKMQLEPSIKRGKSDRKRKEQKRKEKKEAKKKDRKKE